MKEIKRFFLVKFKILSMERKWFYFAVGIQSPIHQKLPEKTHFNPLCDVICILGHIII